MTTMKRLGMIAATVLLASSAGAQDALRETAVMAALKQKYPNTVIKSVSGTALTGIYEVVMGKNVAYVEESGRYFLFGHLFDMQTQTDLTQGKVPTEFAAPARKIDFGALPVKDAVVTVRGDGRRKVAIFSDPDCPYCKQLENNIASVTDVTIYTYLFPLDQLHPQARAKTVGVWCSPDRAKAWENLMRKNEAASGGNCEHPIDRNVALAASLGINGTPTVILADGSLVPGAPSAAKLEHMIVQAHAAGKVAAK